jgi:purine-binding chemotaxis protein CheW
MDMTNQNKNDVNELIQLVSFKVGEEEFGVDILKVQEINKMTVITRVPNAPDFVEGVINLRGRVIPIVDLRKRLGLPEREHDKNTRIIVVEIINKTIGFIVDAVSEVLRISRDITEKPPELVAGIDADYITAVAKLEDRLLILLDLDKVLTKDETEIVGSAAGSAQ